MKVALVHDWLTGMRGGEKVLETFCTRFPDAEVFTLLHVPGSVSPTIERLKIHTSALQRLPGVRHYYRECLPVFPTLVEQFDLQRFDLVISTSHCVAKSAIAGPHAVHICYCLTPMRYAWDQFDAYFGPQRIGRPASIVMRALMDRLASWDRETASRANRYVAISHYVAGRIGRYYNREATVVYPPVDTDFFRPGATESEGYALVVSALVPYKRIDLAIEGCRAAHVPLKIVGTGPERAALQRHADKGGRTEFLGHRSDEEVRDLYRGAAVIVFPGEEDFGIVPVEAQACGRPVVAYARGGALETVVDGETGIHVAEPRAEAFAQAIQAAANRPFDRTAIRRHAERFGRTRFASEIEAVIREETDSRPVPAAAEETERLTRW